MDIRIQHWSQIHAYKSTVELFVDSMPYLAIQLLVVLEGEHLQSSDLFCPTEFLNSMLI